MTEITAAMVKDLREKSGAGMMDAKKALIETNGDMESAIDYLRKKGLAKAEKKSSRTAAEGLVSIALDGTKGVAIEVNAETDFVARNDIFQNYVASLTQRVLSENTPVDAYADADSASGQAVKEDLTNLIAKIGENMAFRRATRLEVANGVVAGYMHGAVVPNMGKIGVLIALESTGDQAKLQELGKQIAMHAAAAFPKYLTSAEVDASELEREKDIIREQARAQGKPEEIIEKMLDGRMRKFYEEICLLEQVYVMDNERKISQVLKDAEKEVGAPVALTGFARYQLGEGIEKEETDFAAEVAAAVNG
ncbi:MAG: elongation factor Ts [Rhodospirillales bacterium]|nr:elongation factor Ts [Rhodospirillales bacterium]MCB9964684.1 elongation factor Ts [Rhodospirillales bacterium]MCB9979974.1 elongation factor Ts [Rhodospirillales bacterium]